MKDKSEIPTIVITTKTSQVRSGRASLPRYISEGNLDEEREGLRPRPLFSESQNDLTTEEADRLLSEDSQSHPDELDPIHIIITVTMETYLGLGEEEPERLEALRSATRTTMSMVTAETGVIELLWVAGIHRNSEQPHVHIAINRAARERETNKEIRIEKLPQQLFAHGSAKSSEEDSNVDLLATNFRNSLASDHQAQA